MTDGFFSNRKIKSIGVIFSLALSIVIVIIYMTVLQKNDIKYHSVNGISSDTSCGPVSLAVVSHYLHQPFTIKEFHNSTGSGELGTCSMLDLLRALREKGFRAKAVRFSQPEKINENRIMILFVDNNHFLVAIPYINNRVFIIDPPNEPAQLNWSDLKDHWRGEAVVVDPPVQNQSEM